MAKEKFVKTSDETFMHWSRLSDIELRYAQKSLGYFAKYALLVLNHNVAPVERAKAARTANRIEVELTFTNGDLDERERDDWESTVAAFRHAEDLFFDQVFGGR